MGAIDFHSLEEAKEFMKQEKEKSYFMETA